MSVTIMDGVPTSAPKDPDDLGVTGGWVVISLSVVRFAWKESTTKRALDMYGSPCLTIGYLISWYKKNE
jgi:hypothetical protein